MVNYCCVQGCGRNSRANKHLNYYSLPKKKVRQNQWLKAAGKEDLLSKDLTRLQRALRFCSRHFAPNHIKNKHLSEDAVPSKCLPGSTTEETKYQKPELHEGVICDNCTDQVIGFRYKCVTCDNYDLCQKCEMLEAHNHHYMLRVPKSLKFKTADDLINKWHEFFKSEHEIPVSDDRPDSTSSDDEPVTKYIRNDDSGVDLSEDIKQNISNEVDRILKLVKNKEKRSKQKRIADKINEIPSKRQRFKKDTNFLIENKRCEKILEVPELAFADVNEQALVKSEEICDIQEPEEQDNLRAFYLKMGIDLSQLAVEVVPAIGDSTL